MLDLQQKPGASRSMTQRSGIPAQIGTHYDWSAILDRLCESHSSPTRAYEDSSPLERHRRKTFLTANALSFRSTRTHREKGLLAAKPYNKVRISVEAKIVDRINL